MIWQLHYYLCLAIYPIFICLQNIAVNHNVMMWSSMLDWVPPDLQHHEKLWLILETVLLKAFFEDVYYVLGSLSQIIQDGLPMNDFMEAVSQKCPCLSPYCVIMFKIVRGLKEHPNVDDGGRDIY